MPRLFISYRHQDSFDLVGRICDRLDAVFGPESYFRDIGKIPPGAEIRSHIAEQVRHYSVVVAVIGPDWVTINDGSPGRKLDDPNDVLRIELETALEEGIPVVPLYVNDAQAVRPDELPERLKPLAGRKGVPVGRTSFSHDIGGFIDDLVEHYGFTRLSDGPSGIGLFFCGASNNEYLLDNLHDRYGGGTRIRIEVPRGFKASSREILRARDWIAEKAASSTGDAQLDMIGYSTGAVRALATSTVVHRDAALKMRIRFLGLVDPTAFDTHIDSELIGSVPSNVHHGVVLRREKEGFLSTCPKHKFVIPKSIVEKTVPNLNHQQFASDDHILRTMMDHMRKAGVPLSD